MHELAKALILCGLVLAGAGILLLLVGKIPGFGKLPGDIAVKKEGFGFYFPLTTCILVSLLLTLLFNLFGKK